MYIQPTHSGKTRFIYLLKIQSPFQDRTVLIPKYSAYSNTGHSMTANIWIIPRLLLIRYSDARFTTWLPESCIQLMTWLPNHLNTRLVQSSSHFCIQHLNLNMNWLPCTSLGTLKKNRFDSSSAFLLYCDCCKLTAATRVG